MSLEQIKNASYDLLGDAGQFLSNAITAPLSVAQNYLQRERGNAQVAKAGVNFWNGNILDSISNFSKGQVNQTLGQRGLRSSLDMLQTTTLPLTSALVAGGFLLNKLRKSKTYNSLKSNNKKQAIEDALQSYENYGVDNYELAKTHFKPTYKQGTIDRVLQSGRQYLDQVKQDAFDFGRKAFQEKRKQTKQYLNQKKSMMLQKIRLKKLAQRQKSKLQAYIDEKKAQNQNDQNVILRVQSAPAADFRAIQSMKRKDQIQKQRLLMEK